MNLIVCIDDKGGMMFNHRRQSQDRELRRDILALTGEKKLWVSPYTARQFRPEEQERLTVSDSFLTEAGAGEFCFAEEGPFAPVREQLETLILYKWNRHYPADCRLDLDPEAEGLSLRETVEFPGFSHEKITREVYCK